MTDSGFENGRGLPHSKTLAAIRMVPATAIRLSVYSAVLRIFGRPRSAVGKRTVLPYGSRMPAQVFRHPYRVTYADCTVGDHVYYGRFLELLETARGELFRHLGVPFIRWQQDNVLLPVVECRLRYKSQAHYDDLLSLEVWLTDLGRVRLTFAYRIINQTNGLILEATTLHACTSLEDKPQRLPDELITLLAPYLDKE